MNQLIQTAYSAFLNWRNTSFSKRKGLALSLSEQLRKNTFQYAQIITDEMFKPITQSISEVEKCAWVSEFYAENFETFLAKQIIKTDAEESFVTYEPLGVILGVMPWNFPFWQVFRFAVPTLLAGNTVVVKHASNVPKSAQLLQEIFERAGFPKGSYTNLPIKSNEVAAIIAHPFVKGVSLTGSESAGKAVAIEAGKHLKKCVLELGGNNAFIVCKDANLEKTVGIAINARMQNAGQSCIAAKRFLIDQSIENEFTELYVNAIKKLKIGDSKDFDTQIGPLARTDLAIELEIQVQKSIEMGAQLILGGTRTDNFYEPTVLTKITPEMPVFKEETFGPVVAMSSFKTIEEAISLSNQSEFGLGVSIFTKDSNAIKKYISLFDEGAVFINELVKSDPRLPFGGVKKSGYGRELAKNGIMEFVNVKTIYIKSL